MKDFWRRLRRWRGLPTVLHITHPKAGSQWVYAFLRYLQPGRVVKPKVRVAHVLKDPVLEGRIYPTIYLSREQLERVRIPRPDLRFVVLRDLRDTLVSMYFSLRHSHPLLTNRHVWIREQLMTRDVPEGLRWTLRYALPRIARIQESWIGSGVPLLRYEEMLSDQHGAFQRIVELCRLKLSEVRLQEAVEACSFERMSGRARGEEDIGAHCRMGVAGDWRRYLRGELKDEFKDRFSGVLIATGYETDDSW